MESARLKGQAFIPAMSTHRSCDGDPPQERTVIERAFRCFKGTL